MIEVKNLCHAFRVGRKGTRQKIHVLKDISFSVKKGELVAIAGRSGSGKSTLLNIISGFLKPNRGEVKIAGTFVTNLNETRFAEFRLHHIGFIFQNFQLILSMTAFQNVELPLILKGMPEAERSMKVDEALERVGLLTYKSHYPSELSGGQQQRVSIARALVVNPPLILADEPTGSLDSDTEDDLLMFMKELNKELGITFLVITHDKKVAQMGNRILKMADGKIMEGVLP